MKKLLFIICLLASAACTNVNDYDVVEQNILRGKISAIDEGHAGRSAVWPRLYIQDNKQTQVVLVGFQDRQLFHVGDTALLIIKTVKPKK